MSLSIMLFGPLEARYDDQPLSGFEYNKVRALLAFLAMEAHRPHTRASLSTLLWPEQGESAARQNLSQALTTLRKVLRDRQAAAPYLLTTTDSVQLNPNAEIEVDTARFNALIDASEAHRHRGWHLCSQCATRNRVAAALYRDDFLAQLYVSDSAPFEEWALLCRERLRQRMLSTLERLLLYAEWRGAYDEALQYARRQVEMEPLRDGVHRTLMRLLALDGQLAAALAQYEFLRHALQNELGEEPEEATTELAMRIRSGRQLNTLRHMAAPSNTLLEPPTSIVGRTTEVEALLALLDDEKTRVLTIVGPPGVGKTRLALEVVHRLKFRYEHGVHVVELAPVNDADDVVVSIAQVLGITEHSEVLSDALMSHLKQRHTLLLLDNFEHVVGAAVHVADLLKACPGLSVLITSRTPLQLRAEQQYPLDPLPLPPSDADPALALAADAVRLLVERARMVQPGWTIAPESVATIVAICERAEGLPLALELLAPRLKTLSPAEMLQQLERRLSVHGTGARDAPLRHHTLRSAIQWSYDRLSVEEQHVFLHLGVFSGSCTMEAIAAVSGVPTTSAALEALRDASLVQPQRSEYETRWTMLETIREYALELLESNGNVGEARVRHARHFTQLAEQAKTQLIGPDQPRWSTTIAADIDNLRGALRWLVEHGEVEAALVLSGGIWRWWWQRGFLREGLEWLRRILVHPHAATEADALAMRAAGIFANGINDYAQAKHWFESSRDMAMHFEDVEAYAAATTNLGTTYRETGELDRASTFLAESIAIARTFEPVPNWLKFPLLILARVRERQGEWDTASALFEEALQLNRQVGDAEGTADALQGVAFCAGLRGDFTYARECCDESLRIYTTLEHQYGIAWSHVAYGRLAHAEGRYLEALQCYQHSLMTWIEREDQVAGAEVLDYIAEALCGDRRYAETVSFTGAANAMRAFAQAVLSPYEEAVRARLLQHCRAELDRATYEAALSYGKGMTLEQAASSLGQQSSTPRRPNSH